MNKPDIENLIEKLAIMAWNHDGEQKDALIRAIECICRNDPVKPTHYTNDMCGMEYTIYKCGVCKWDISRINKYCPMCGTKVKWND